MRFTVNKIVEKYYSNVDEKHIQEFINIVQKNLNKNMNDLLIQLVKKNYWEFVDILFIHTNKSILFFYDYVEILIDYYSSMDNDNDHGKRYLRFLKQIITPDFLENMYSSFKKEKDNPMFIYTEDCGIPLPTLKIFGSVFRENTTHPIIGIFKDMECDNMIVYIIIIFMLEYIGSNKYMLERLDLFKNKNIPDNFIEKIYEYQTSNRDEINTEQLLYCMSIVNGWKNERMNEKIRLMKTMTELEVFNKTVLEYF